MPRILLVDDDEIMRNALRALLHIRSRHSIVGEAATGAEGLAIASAERVDVAVVDVRLPDMDGVQVARELAAMSPPVPAVIISGHVDGGLARRAEKFPLVKKNDAFERLVDAIDSAVRGESRVD